MVTCNVCRKNKQVEDMQTPFRYVCKECWDLIEIIIPDEEGNKVSIEKDRIY